jgi:hypothetical protein
MKNFYPVNINVQPGGRLLLPPGVEQDIPLPRQGSVGSIAILPNQGHGRRSEIAFDNEQSFIIQSSQ